MKRFYCTVCKRVKRVQNYPSNVMDTGAVSPTDRVGQCRSHFSQPTRNVVRQFKPEVPQEVKQVVINRKLARKLRAR